MPSRRGATTAATRTPTAASNVLSTTAAMPTAQRYPSYRLLTGPDDAAFCHRVSRELERGFVLYGPPCLTFDGKRVIAGQAIVWPAENGLPPMVDGSPAIENV